MQNIAICSIALTHMPQLLKLLMQDINRKVNIRNKLVSVRKLIPKVESMAAIENQE